VAAVVHRSYGKSGDNICAAVYRTLGFTHPPDI
jgi:hypothetical protein